MLDDYIGLVIALGLALAAGTALRRSIRWRSRAHAVEGCVIDMRRSRSIGSNSRYPVIAFETQAGEEVQFQSNIKFIDAELPIGAAVPVLYNPENPRQACIAKVHYVHFWAIMLAIIALMVGAVWFAKRTYGL